MKADTLTALAVLGGFYLAATAVTIWVDRRNR